MISLFMRTGFRPKDVPGAEVERTLQRYFEGSAAALAAPYDPVQEARALARLAGWSDGGRNWDGDTLLDRITSAATGPGSIEHAVGSAMERAKYRKVDEAKRHFRIVEVFYNFMREFWFTPLSREEVNGSMVRSLLGAGVRGGYEYVAAMFGNEERFISFVARQSSICNFLLHHQFQDPLNPGTPPKRLTLSQVARLRLSDFHQRALGYQGGASLCIDGTEYVLDDRGMARMHSYVEATMDLYDALYRRRNIDPPLILGADGGGILFPDHDQKRRALCDEAAGRMLAGLSVREVMALRPENLSEGTLRLETDEGRVVVRRLSDETALKLEAWLTARASMLGQFSLDESNPNPPLFCRPGGSPIFALPELVGTECFDEINGPP